MGRRQPTHGTVSAVLGLGGVREGVAVADVLTNYPGGNRPEG